MVDENALARLADPKCPACSGYGYDLLTEKRMGMIVPCACTTRSTTRSTTKRRTPTS